MGLFDLFKSKEEKQLNAAKLIVSSFVEQSLFFIPENEVRENGLSEDGLYLLFIGACDRVAQVYGLDDTLFEDLCCYGLEKSKLFKTDKIEIVVPYVMKHFNEYIEEKGFEGNTIYHGGKLMQRFCEDNQVGIILGAIKVFINNKWDWEKIKEIHGPKWENL